MKKDRGYRANTFHHVFNRGTNNMVVFRDRGDYLYFLGKMREYKYKTNISVLCYCLLPNHFHLFLKQIEEDKKIGKFTSDLGNSYTKMFNKKYNRNGVLFQGKTKNVPVIKQEQFIWLCKYILNNPVRKKLVAKSVDWEYSSCRDYFGIRKGTLTDQEEVLNNFENINEFINMIDEPIGFEYSEYTF